MDEENSTTVFFRTALLGWWAWYYWPAAMGAVAAWFWYRTRFVGVLLMTIGFFTHAVLQVINARIPQFVQQPGADPEPLYVTLHFALGMGAIAGLVVALVGFVWLAVSAAAQKKVQAADSV